MSLSLRPAAVEDAGFMADLLRHWVAETPWMPDVHGEAGTQAFCINLVPDTLIARDGRADVGFLTRQEAELACLYVAPSVRGQGVGAALLAHAQNMRPRLGVWSFAANTSALRFYARHGFAETARTMGENDENLPDIRLEWSRR